MRGAGISGVRVRSFSAAVVLSAILALVLSGCPSSRNDKANDDKAKGESASTSSKVKPLDNPDKAKNSSESKETEKDQTPPAALAQALVSWNRATNEADRAGLERLYAPSLLLYGRIVKNEAAVSSKLDYVKQHPGFEQRVQAANWQRRETAQGDEWSVLFEKTSRAQGEEPQKVEAYLLFRKVDGEFFIVDEGDTQTSRKLQAKLDTERKKWGDRRFDCPDCTWSGPDGVPAYPPLGPRYVVSTAKRPPGLPKRIEYGRLLLNRFASAVDIPFFVEVTETSHNGDGRWLHYTIEQDEKEVQLFHCALGGHYNYEFPLPGQPDPGHAGEPPITFVENWKQRAEGLSYEKTIYSKEVHNFVSCEIHEDYRDFFITIAQRMGKSLRAVCGGWGADRPCRESVPYLP